MLVRWANAGDDIEPTERAPTERARATATREGRANRREDGGTGWWSADGKLITAMERELEPERSSQYRMNLVKSRRPNLEATAGGPTNVIASDEHRTVTYGDNAERYAADGS